MREGMQVAVARDAGRSRPGKIVRLYNFEGLKRVEAKEAGPARSSAWQASTRVDIGDTLCDLESPVPLERIHVDEPTLSMIFRVNDGPFAGREGKYVTSRNLAERLHPRGLSQRARFWVLDTESPPTPSKVLGRRRAAAGRDRGDHAAAKATS